MKETENYKLKKPDVTEFFDVENHFNYNANIIDKELSNLNKQFESIDTTAEKTTIKDTNNNFISDNVEGALEELFTNVSNGKTSIAQAITDKGVNASSEETFTQLSDKIRSIETITQPIPMKSPTWIIGEGSITAICDTAEGVFWQFRINGGDWKDDNRFEGLTGNTQYIFEGKYGSNRVSILTINTPKANQSKPTKPTVTDYNDERISVSAPSGCKIKYGNSLYDSPYTFTRLTHNTNYNFYAIKPGSNNLNESPLSDALVVKTKQRTMEIAIYQQDHNNVDTVYYKTLNRALSVINTKNMIYAVKVSAYNKMSSCKILGANSILSKSDTGSDDMAHFTFEGKVIKRVSGSSLGYSRFTACARDIESNKIRYFTINSNKEILELDSNLNILKRTPCVVSGGMPTIEMCSNMKSFSFTCIETYYGTSYFYDFNKSRTITKTFTFDSDDIYDVHVGFEDDFVMSVFSGDKARIIDTNNGSTIATGTIRQPGQNAWANRMMMTEMHV